VKLGMRIEELGIEEDLTQRERRKKKI